MGENHGSHAAALVSSEALTREDIEELRAYFNGKEEAQ